MNSAILAQQIMHVLDNFFLYICVDVCKDAPIPDFTDILITDIIWPIMADTDNRFDIFQYFFTFSDTSNEGLHGQH